MNKLEAMKVLRMSVLTQKILKQAYVKACFRFHPDRNPEGLEMMKQVNAAYTFLKTIKDDESVSNETFDTDTQVVDFGPAMNAAIASIIDLEGVHIEICGSWIWLSGDTRTHKDTIKAAGFYWASKKLMWYWHPADQKASSRGKATIDDIRTKYGSSEVKQKQKQRTKLTA